MRRRIFWAWRFKKGGSFPGPIFRITSYNVCYTKLLRLLAPIVILGGLYGGIFTPTESAVVAVVYSLFVSLVVYRSLTLRDLFQIFADASESSAVVMIIVAFATLFAWAGSTVGVLDRAASAMIGFSENRYVLLLLINLLLLVAGMLMDPVTIYYIFLPVLIPRNNFV